LVQQQVKAGHVESSNSPWNSPIFVIEKKPKENIEYYMTFKPLTRPGKLQKLYNLASHLMP
jgi:hypothetical protein